MHRLRLENPMDCRGWSRRSRGDLDLDLLFLSFPARRSAEPDQPVINRAFNQS